MRGVSLPPIEVTEMHFSTQNPQFIISNRADVEMGEQALRRVTFPPAPALNQPPHPPPTKSKLERMASCPFLPLLTSSSTLESIPDAEFKILSEFCKDKATNFSPMIKSLDDQPNIFQPTSKNI